MSLHINKSLRGEYSSKLTHNKWLSIEMTLIVFIIVIRMMSPFFLKKEVNIIFFNSEKNC